MASSLLVENASRGLKTLICDFYGEEWSFGAEEPLSLKTNNPSYDIFKERVDSI